MTDFPIVYERQARIDLTNQFDFIFDQSGPDRAVAFIERIESLVDKLGVFPEIGRVLSRKPVCFRAVALKGHAYVIYNFDGTRIVVLRVFGKGQDVDNWLSQMVDEFPPPID